MVLERKSGIFTSDPLVQEADQLANTITTCGCVPDWAIRKAEWYALGFISAQDLINETEYLVEQGIITINNTVIQEPEPVFDPLGDFSNFINEIIVEPVTTFVDDTTSGIVKGIDDITQGADDFITNAQKGIDDTISGADDWIKTQQLGIDQFFTQSQTNIDAFVADSRSNIEGLFAGFEQFKVDVGTNIEGIGEGFAQFGADVQTNFDNLGSAFEKGFEAFGAGTAASSQFFENAKNFLSGAGVGALVIVGVLVFFAVRTPKVGKL